MKTSLKMLILIMVSIFSLQTVFAQHMSVFSFDMGCSMETFADYLIKFKGFHIDNNSLKGQFMGEECEIENIHGGRNCDLIIISVPFWVATPQAKSHMKSWLDTLFSNYNKKYNKMSTPKESLPLSDHFTSANSHNVMEFGYGWSCNYGYVFVFGMHDADFEVSYDIKICYIDEASVRMNQNKNNGYTDY